jgi:hypothetical protein
MRSKDEATSKDIGFKRTSFWLFCHAALYQPFFSECATFIFSLHYFVSLSHLILEIFIAEMGEK